jgi:hypothetical protein
MLAVLLGHSRHDLAHEAAKRSADCGKSTTVKRPESIVDKLSEH